MLTDKIESAIEHENTRMHVALNEILRLIFWKDYSAGHLSGEDISNIIALIDKYEDNDDPEHTWFSGFREKDKLYEFIDGLRAKIGFDKLPFDK